MDSRSSSTAEFQWCGPKQWQKTLLACRHPHPASRCLTIHLQKQRWQMQHVTRKTTCRLCGSSSLQLVLPILPSAIGDAFVSAERLQEKQDLYPLDCYLCLDCGHLQNLDVVDPEILFREYTYRTSVSQGLVEHFRKYARSVVSGLAIPKDSLVVEIGSNDGSL